MHRQGEEGLCTVDFHRSQRSSVERTPGHAQSTQVPLVEATSGFEGQAMLYPLTDHICVGGYDMRWMPSYV